MWGQRGGCWFEIRSCFPFGASRGYVLEWTFVGSSFIGSKRPRPPQTSRIRGEFLALAAKGERDGSLDATIWVMTLFRQPPGLLVLFAVVLAGLGSGTVFYRTQATKVRAGVLKRLEAAPTDPNEQLTAWLEFGEPMIQHRLTQLSFGSGAPWLVTHTAGGSGGNEVWGISMEGPRPARFERDGTLLKIHLSTPRFLDHRILSGDNADKIPHYPDGAPEGQAELRAKELIEWFLQKVISALPDDIEGAAIEVIIGEVAEEG